jgi:hypothetical protein
VFCGVVFCAGEERRFFVAGEVAESDADEAIELLVAEVDAVEERDGCGRKLLDVADLANAGGDEVLLGDFADARNAADGKLAEEAFDLKRLDDKETVGLAPIRGDLGEERVLVRSGPGTRCLRIPSFACPQCFEKALSLRHWRHMICEDEREVVTSGDERSSGAGHSPGGLVLAAARRQRRGPSSSYPRSCAESSGGGRLWYLA